MKYIFIKEVIKPEGKEFSAFTALTDVLKSEGLFHLYMVIFRRISETSPFKINKNERFNLNDIIIRKIKPNLLYEILIDDKVVYKTDKILEFASFDNRIKSNVYIIYKRCKISLTHSNYGKRKH